MTHSNRNRAHRDRYQASESEYLRSPNPKRLYRSRNERVWAGVCGGIAERFGWDPLVVRLVALIGFFSIPGPPILLAYIAMWMLVSKAPMTTRTMDAEEEAFWRGVSDRPKATTSGLKYTFMDLEDRLRNLERNVTSDEWRLRRQFRDLEKN